MNLRNKALVGSRRLYLLFVSFLIVQGIETVEAQDQNHLYTFLSPGSAQLPPSPFGPVTLFYGNLVRGAGDVDADGFADVMAGGPSTGFMPGGGLVEVYSGKTGKRLHTFVAQDQQDLFAWSFDTAGDVDGDGYSDLIVGAPLGQFASGLLPSAEIFSGKDGSVLGILSDSNPSSKFGSTVAGVGDLDSDGNDDVLIGSAQAGVVTVFSGKWIVSGQNPPGGGILYQFGGFPPTDLSGLEVRGCGDINGDHIPELLIAWTAQSAQGKVSVYSGSDGSLLHQFLGKDPALDPPGTQSDLFGRSVEGGHDLDRDGFSDIVVGAPWDGSNGTHSGRVEIYSGKQGTLLHTLYGNAAFSNFGSAVAFASDINRDGYPDLAVRYGLLDAANNDAVDVFSGEWIAKTAKGVVPQTSLFLAQLVKTPSIESIANAEDVNRDGASDMIVGIPAQKAQVFSGKKLALAGNKHLASLANGAIQDLQLDAGPNAANMSYLVLGSATDITPGIPIDGVTISLVQDRYYDFTLLSPNTGPLVDTFGTLDAQGKATAAFQLPPGSDPSLAGLTLWHAYVVVDTLGLSNSVVFASNPIPLTLEP